MDFPSMSQNITMIKNQKIHLIELVKQSKGCGEHMYSRIRGSHGGQTNRTDNSTVQLDRLPFKNINLVPETLQKLTRDSGMWSKELSI